MSTGEASRLGWQLADDAFLSAFCDVNVLPLLDLHVPAKSLWLVGLVR